MRGYDGANKLGGHQQPRARCPSASTCSPSAEYISRFCVTVETVEGGCLLLTATIRAQTAVCNVAQAAAKRSRQSRKKEKRRSHTAIAVPGVSRDRKREGWTMRSEGRSECRCNDPSSLRPGGANCKYVGAGRLRRDSYSLGRKVRYRAPRLPERIKGLLVVRVPKVRIPRVPIRRRSLWTVTRNGLIYSADSQLIDQF